MNRYTFSQPKPKPPKVKKIKDPYADGFSIDLRQLEYESKQMHYEVQRRQYEFEQKRREAFMAKQNRDAELLYRWLR